MPIVSLDDQVVSGDVQLPYDRYRLKVREATFGPSKSSGNPMTTLICEIIAPETIESADGKTFAVAGKEVRYYLPYTDSMLGRCAEMLRKLEVLDKDFSYLDSEGNEQIAHINSQQFDTDNVPTAPFKNLSFDAILWSQEKVKRRMPSPEQRAKGQLGDPLLDENGKEIKLGWETVATLDNIIGNPAWEDASNPY